MLQYSQQETMVRNKLDQTLLKCVFEKMWLKRFEDHLHLYSVISLREAKLIKNVFHSWKKLLYTDIKASDYSRTNLLKSALRDWKLSVKLKTFKQKHKAKILSNSYCTWKRRIQYGKISNNHIRITFYARYFNAWKRKMLQIRSANEGASIFYKQGLTNECLAIWKERVIKSKELEDRYNFLSKTHAILTIKRTVMHINNVHLLSNKLEPYMNRIKLSGTFSKWRKATNFRIKHKLNDILHTYELDKKYELQYGILLHGRTDIASTQKNVILKQFLRKIDSSRKWS